MSNSEFRPSIHFCDLSTMDLPDFPSIQDLNPACPPNLIRQVMNTKYGVKSKSNRIEFIFNGPATIFFCGDKKAVVKRSKLDNNNFLNGATMAMLKMFTSEEFYKAFKKYYRYKGPQMCLAAEGILLYKLGEQTLKFYDELAIKGLEESHHKQLV